MSGVSDRKLPPLSAEPPALRMPRVERFTLTNGLRVLVVEQHALPVFDVQLIFRTGAVVDSADAAGLTSIAVDMLDEGAGDLTALGLAEAVEDLGASMHASAGWDDIGFGMHAHTDRLAPALDLLADVIMRPAITHEDFERKKQQRLAALLQERDEPRALASRAFASTIFGDAHPYGRPVHGTRKSVESLTRDQVVNFHTSYIRPDRAFLVAVGDFKSAPLREMLERSFAGWTGASVEAPAVPEAPPATTAAIHVVDRPGSAQSELRVGRIGLARSSPDYFPVLVMNTILGGSFTSRLNLNLRQEKGYTYGAGSNFGFRLWPGPFLVSTAVDTNVTADAVRQIMHEITRIREELVPADELARAQSYIALGLPRTFETTSDIAGHVSELELYGLPGTYYDDFVGNIRGVTASDVQRVARSYLDPATMAVVLAGDYGATAESLGELGLGPVHKRPDED